MVDYCTRKGRINGCLLSACGSERVFTPALLFYKELILKNLALAIQIAGSPARLRPHVKTHKTREIVALELGAGITKHKCATIAEAEMLASCGVTDVFIAYNMVGPNCSPPCQACADVSTNNFRGDRGRPRSA